MYYIKTCIKCLNAVSILKENVLKIINIRGTFLFRFFLKHIAFYCVLFPACCLINDALFHGCDIGGL